MGVSSMAGKRFHSITVICGSGTCDPGTLFAAQELVILGPCLHRTVVLTMFAAEELVLLVLLVAALEAKWQTVNLDKRK